MKIKEGAYGGMILTGVENVPEDIEKNLNVIQKFIQELPQKTWDVGVRVLFAVICLIVGLQIIKLLRKFVKKSLQRANADLGVIQFIDSFVKMGLYVVLGFMIASNFGLDAASIVAVVGSAGVAIGLALQGSLSNLAGGVLILILKPFRVGDYIVEDSKGNQGTVTEISMFYTKLTTADGKIIILPNGTLANNSLTNVSAAKNRRLDVTVGISYNADIALAKKILLDIMTQDEASLKDQEIVAFVDALGSSEVVIGGRCYVANDDYFPMKWRVLEKVKLAYDESGIEIPFAQMDVHVTSGDAVNSK